MEAMDSSGACMFAGDEDRAEPRRVAASQDATRLLGGEGARPARHAVPRVVQMLVRAHLTELRNDLVAFEVARQDDESLLSAIAHVEVAVARIRAIVGPALAPLTVAAAALEEATCAELNRLLAPGAPASPAGGQEVPA